MTKKIYKQLTLASRRSRCC